MGEIDTKSIVPVQVALTHFGERGDHQKRVRYSGRSSSEEMDKETDMKGILLRDLANCKLQLEAKESGYQQLLIRLDHYQTTIEELCNHVKRAEAERDARMEESREARTRAELFESKVKEMTDDQVLEKSKLREQLSHALSELKARQLEMLVMETELASATEMQTKALMEAEMAETAAATEKERAEDLLKHAGELNEAVLLARMEAAEAENEKFVALSEKDNELECARGVVAEVQEQVEEMKVQLDMMKELENQLLAKSVWIDLLQAELHEAKELLGSSEQAVSEATSDLNELKRELQDKEREDLNKAVYIEALEGEMSRLQLELGEANAIANGLNCDVKMITNELEKAKFEVLELKARENDAQVEVALLKAELHEGRSKLAAAEAAESRADSLRSGLYLAVEQLAVEAEEAKQENIRFKQGGEKGSEESDELALVVFHEEIFYSQTEQANDYLNPEAEEQNLDHRSITLSLEDYEALIARAENAEQSAARQLTRTDSTTDPERLRKDLEAAVAKVGEFRTRAEQAATRAEAAERAKAELEDRITRWRDRRQKRKAALAALRKDASTREFTIDAYSSYPPTPTATPPYASPTPSYDTGPKCYQPLFKVLNMKF